MPFLIVFLVCAAILSVIFKTPRFKGWLGEMCVKLVIGKTKPGVKYVINDFKIRVSEGKTAQIDHVLINKCGIFVIETKNYSGRIYGQEESLEWTQVLNYGKVKNKLYNPIKQNKTHVFLVSQILGQDVPIISSVVFVQGNIQFINASGVYTLWGLKKLINNENSALSLEEMVVLNGKLLQANDESISNLEHINNINTAKSNISNNICPRCGKKLVMRNGKNGRFMGCEGYPNCKFTKNI